VERGKEGAATTLTRKGEREGVSSDKVKGVSGDEVKEEESGKE
jgi:hypothetical protein